MPKVTTRSSSPTAHLVHLYATTYSNDKLLIVLSVLVNIATRPLRALLELGATNNFVRADNLKVLPSRLSVRGSPGNVIVE